MTKPTAPRAAPSVLLHVEQLRREVPGGIGTYAAGLISGLQQLDRRERPLLTLLASRSKQRPDPLRSYAVPLITSSFSSRVATRLWDLNLLRIKTSSQIVHSVSLGITTANVPQVVTVHDLAWRRFPEAYPPRGRRWHERALSHAAGRAVHFVVPSEEVRAALTEAGVGINDERITTIEEGTDHLPPPDDVGTRHLLRQLGVHGEFLLTCGTLEPRKNLARLIDAYVAVRPTLPEPWTLIVVGPKGWGGSVRTDHEGVHFVGAVTPAVLSGLYHEARLLAYVPLSEGFGLPVVEAMRAQTPVVSSDVPSAGGATRLVDPFDVDSIADALYVVATESEVRLSLSELGSRRVENMTWRAAAKSHMDVWNAVIQANGPRA